ncbi:Alpha/Beta hydrolase protein [Aspergillus avenaceus]|uniref:feruloyl esterase n=1 Tax=Aspergillus avenaceus TaxID=36643 RepID=A0A5N6U6E3_ASPAV|nr:Alpha/Beta hydrolase protein [Aspergillus avenaceus]
MVKLSLMLIIVACVWRCCAIPLRHSGKGASPYPNSTATSDYREATFEELQRAAKHSAAAYTICPGKAFDVYLTKYFTHLLTGTEGYVGYSTNRKVIAVVFRGSTSFIDVANNLDTKTVVPHIPNVEFPLGAGIMQGIYRPYMSVHDEIVMQIANLQLRYPDYAIEITGHSLGGSLVYLAHIAINQIFKDSNITSYALSAYPIGNQVYANFGAAQRGVLFRGNPKDDGVPVS